MRLILEKDEIVTILGKHFDVALDPERVIIRTDPLEIEVSGIPMSDAPTKEETNVVSLNTTARRQSQARDEEEKVAVLRDDPDATTEPPPPGKDGTEGEGNADVHPAAVLAASKALENELDRENPQLKRRAGKWSAIAPKDFNDEIP